MYRERFIKPEERPTALCGLFLFFVPPLVCLFCRERTVLVDGLQVSGSPFEVEVSAGPPSGTNATASGSALALATAGENASFVIQVLMKSFFIGFARAESHAPPGLLKPTRTSLDDGKRADIGPSYFSLFFSAHFSYLPASHTPSPTKSRLSLSHGSLHVETNRKKNSALDASLDYLVVRLFPLWPSFAKRHRREQRRLISNAQCIFFLKPL